MTGNCQKPALRFTGFTDAWEQQKLDDMANNTYGGGTPGTSDLSLWNGEIPWIQSSDVKEDEIRGVIAKSSVTLKGLNESATKLVPSNSIAVVVRVGVGKLALMPYSYSASQDFISFSNLKIDGLFGAYALLIKMKTLAREVQGTSIKGITKEELLKKEIYVSKNVVEQNKIGSFFDQFDNLITLHQRKYDKLTNIKKAMLEKLFPESGSNVPKIRFNAFTDAWEQRKLQDLALITMGQSPDGNTYSDTPSKYILVQGNADLKDGWVLPRIWTTQAIKKASAGDLIMSVRAPAGTIGKTQYPIVIGRGVASIKGNEFIFQSLSKMDMGGYWTKLSTGSTFESLNCENISNAELSVPNKKEQDNIGNLLLSLDNLITLHQHELEKLKNIKKSLLGKMFL